MYDNSTYTLTMADGEVRTYASDGAHTGTTWPDSRSETYDALGRVLSHREANGALTTRVYSEQGGYTATYPGGIVEVFRGDGTRASRTESSGFKFDYAADGSTVVGRQSGNGVVWNATEDGSQTLELANGFRTTITTDGTATTVDSRGGQVISTYSAVSATLQYFDASGTYVEQVVNLNTLDEYLSPSGGSEVSLLPGGRSETYRTDGSTLELGADGSIEQITLQDGGSTVTAALQLDGTYALTLADGRSFQWRSDASLAQVSWADGRSLTFDTTGFPTSWTKVGDVVESCTYTHVDDCLTVTPSDAPPYMRTLPSWVRARLGSDGTFLCVDAQAREVVRFEPGGTVKTTWPRPEGGRREIFSDGSVMVIESDYDVAAWERFDVDGRIVSSGLGDGRSATYTYMGTDVLRKWTGEEAISGWSGGQELLDAHGRLLWSEDGNGSRTYFDAQQRTVAVRSGVSVTVTSYAADGTATTRTGSVLSTQSDGSLRVDFGNGEAVRFSSRGVLTWEGQADGTERFHDAQGRLWLDRASDGSAVLTSYDPIAGPSTQSVEATKNADGTITLSLSGVTGDDIYSAGGVHLRHDTPEAGTPTSTASGVTLTQDENGDPTWTLASGTVVRLVGQSGTATFASGRSGPAWAGADGGVSFIDDGNVMTKIMADLSVRSYTYGTIQEFRLDILHPDGTREVQTPAITRTFSELEQAEGFPGTGVTATSGLTIEQDDSGRQIFTLPNGVVVRMAGKAGTAVTASGHSTPAWRGVDGSVSFIDDGNVKTTITADLVVKTSSYGATGEVRVKMVHPEGQVEIRFPDGSQTYTQVDGSLVTRDPSGLLLQTTVNEDGSISVERPDGTVVCWAADNSTTITARNGVAIHLDSTTSSRTYTLPGGLSLTTNTSGTPTGVSDAEGTFDASASRTSDGSLTFHYRDGRRATLGSDLTLTVEYGSEPYLRSSVTHPDGSISIQDGAGFRVALSAAGVVQGTDPYGNVLTGTAHSDGSLTLHLVDGTDRIYYRDLSDCTTYASGLSILTRPGGACEATLPDGTVLSYSAAGVLLQARDAAEAALSLDGSRAILEDGRKVRVDGDAVVTTQVNGESLRLEADGDTILLDANGTETGRQYAATHVNLDGTSATRDAQGLATTLGATDGTALQHEDGTWEVDHSDGSLAQFDVHGTLTGWSFQVPNGGLTREVLGDGSLRYTLPGGTIITRSLDLRAGQQVLSCNGGDVHVQADGSLQMVQADGKTTVIAPDLTLARTDSAAPSYRFLQHADGSSVTTNHDGTVVTHGTDGAVVSIISSTGVSAQQQVDDSYCVTLPDRSVSTFDEAGAFISNDLALAEGYTRHVGPDGTCRYDLADGTWVEKHGSQLTAGHAGATATAVLTSSGSIRVEVPGGTWVVTEGHEFEFYGSGFLNRALDSSDPQRSLALEVMWNGEVRACQVDGSVAATSAEGVVTVVTSSGVTAQEQADGTFEATLPDGSCSRYDAQGALLDNQTTHGSETTGYRGDGTTFWEFTSGLTRVVSPGGSMTWTVSATGSAGTIHVTLATDASRTPSALAADGTSLSVAWKVEPTSLQNDASVHPQNTGCLEISLGDGSVGRLFMNGLWMRSRDDGQGLAEVLRPDGIHTTIDANGNPSSVAPGGTSIQTSVDANGAFTTQGAWGGLTVGGPDTWTWNALSGLVLSHTSQLTQWTLPDGLAVQADAWGYLASGWHWAWSTDEPDMSVSLSRRTDPDGLTHLRLDLDGRVTTSYANGSTVIQFADGARQLMTPGVVPPGATLEVAEDGSTTTVAENGAIVEFDPAGRGEWTFPQGFKVTQHADGSTTLQAADGSTLVGWSVDIDQDSSGQWTSITLKRPDGGTWTLQSNLEERATSPLGMVHTRQADGTETWVLPGGTTVEKIDGTLHALDASGQSIDVVQDANGSLVLTDARGITARVLPDNTVQYQIGDLTETDAMEGWGNCVHTYSLADGIVVNRRNDGGVDSATSHDGVGRLLGKPGSARASADLAGNVTLTYPDGRVRVLADLGQAFGLRPASAPGDVTRADGTVIRLLEQGVIETIHLSGQVDRLARNGLVEMQSPDGLKSWRLPEGTLVHQAVEGSFGSNTWRGGGASPVDARGVPFYILATANGGFRTVAEDGTMYDVDAATLSVTVTMPDGEQSRQAADGTFSILRNGTADASPEIRRANADGSTAIRDGLTGALTFTFPESGTVTQAEADGTITAIAPSGARSTYDVDGLLLSTSAAGVTRTYRRDGSVASVQYVNGVRVAYLEGTIRRNIFLPDGRWFTAEGNGNGVGSVNNAPPGSDYGPVTRVNGTIALVHIDDARTLEEVAQDFTVTVYDDNGRRATVYGVDGTTTHYASWGVVLRVDHPDGTALVHQADGSTLALASDGTPLQIALPDDVQAVHQEDGTWQATAADGTVTTYAADGTPVERVLAQGAGTITYASDGSSAKTTGDSRTIHFRADGTRKQETSPDGVVTLCDSLGRPETVTRSATDVDHYQYNSDGTVRVVNSATGEERILSSTGSLIRLTTSDRHITTYDAQGRRSLEVTPEAAWTHFTYAADGSSTGSRSDGTIDSYDVTGRLFHSVLTNGATIEYPTDPAIQSVTTWLSGQVRTLNSDGTIQVYALGYTAICATDETWTATGANSAVVPVEAGSDGTLRIQGTDEWVEIQPTGPVADFASDGTTKIFTLGVDGSRTDFGSGQARTVTRTDSSQDVYDVHGNRIRHRDTSGVTTVSNPDRSTATLGSNGQIQAIKMKDGTDAAFDSTDGCWKHVASDGTTTRFNSNGSLYSVETADGGVRTFGTNGHSLLMRPDSAIEEAEEYLLGQRVLLSIRYSDGTVERPLRNRALGRFDASGNLLGVRTADGTAAVQAESGEWVATDSQGTRTCYSSSGELLSYTSTDNTTVEYEPGGATVTHYSDGSQQSVASDGTRTTLRTDGSLIVARPDGTTLDTDVHGTVVQKNPDGTRTITLTAGVVTSVDANGFMVTTLAGGSTVRMTGYGALWQDGVLLTDANGLTLDLAGGTALRWRSGAMRIEYADGAWQQLQPGIESSSDAAGNKSTSFGSGITRTESALGAITYLLPDDTVITSSPDGVVETCLPDCTVVSRNGSTAVPVVSGALGVTSTLESDSSVRVLDQYGTVTRVNSNGFPVVIQSNGSTATYSPDGSYVQVDSDGSTTVTAADGTRTSTSSSWETMVRADRATVTSALDTLVEQYSYPDGRVVTRYGGNATTDYSPDGTLTTSFSDGSSIIRDETGELHVHLVNSNGPFPLESDGAGGWTARFDWKAPVYVTSPSTALPILAYDPAADPSYTPVMVHWYVSGSIVFEEPDGASVTSHPDGSMLVQNADGGTVLTSADGTRVTQAVDGSRTVNFADGRVLRLSSDATTTVMGADGLAMSWSQTGTVSRTALGVVTSWTPDGTTMSEDITGSLIRFANGLTVQTFADGHSLYTAPDGVQVLGTVDSAGHQTYSAVQSTVQASALTATTIGEDGSITIRLTGRTLQFNADGTSQATLQDGTVVDQQAAGGVSVSKGDSVTTASSDGLVNYHIGDVSVTVDTKHSTTEVVGPEGTVSIAANGVVTQHTGSDTIVTTPNGVTIVNGASPDVLLTDDQGVRPTPLSVLDYSFSDTYGSDLASHAMQGYKYVIGSHQTDPVTGKTTFIPKVYYRDTLHLIGDPDSKGDGQAGPKVNNSAPSAMGPDGGGDTAHAITLPDDFPYDAFNRAVNSLPNGASNRAYNGPQRFEWCADCHPSKWKGPYYGLPTLGSHHTDEEKEQLLKVIFWSTAVLATGATENPAVGVAVYNFMNSPAGQNLARFGNLVNMWQMYNDPGAFAALDPPGTMVFSAGHAMSETAQMIPASVMLSPRNVNLPAGVTMSEVPVMTSITNDVTPAAKPIGQILAESARETASAAEQPVVRPFMTSVGNAASEVSNVPQPINAAMGAGGGTGGLYLGSASGSGTGGTGGTSTGGFVSGSTTNAGGASNLPPIDLLPTGDLLNPAANYTGIPKPKTGFPLPPQAIIREEETAEAFTEAGYRTIREPWTYLGCKPGDQLPPDNSGFTPAIDKQPDYWVEGFYVDGKRVYSTTAADAMFLVNKDKILPHQVERIALNLDDCPLTAADIRAYMNANSGLYPGIKQLFVDKGGVLESIYFRY